MRALMCLGWDNACAGHTLAGRRPGRDVKSTSLPGLPGLT